MCVPLYEEIVEDTGGAPDWQRLIDAEPLLSGRDRRDPSRYEFSSTAVHKITGSATFAEERSEAVVTDKEVRALVTETVKTRTKPVDPAARFRVKQHNPASTGDYSRFDHNDLDLPKHRKLKPRPAPPKPSMIEATLIGQRFKAYLLARGANTRKK